MPRRETGQDQANNARYDNQEDDIDRCKLLQVLILLKDLGPDPVCATPKTNPAKGGGVYQEQDERLVIM